MKTFLFFLIALTAFSPHYSASGLDTIEAYLEAKEKSMQEKCNEGRCGEPP